jgi:hypothetical protein
MLSVNTFIILKTLIFQQCFHFLKVRLRYIIIINHPRQLLFLILFINKIINKVAREQYLI